MGAVVGGLSGFIVLVFTYFTSRPRRAPPPPIQEVRMAGVVDSTLKNSTPGMLFPGLNMEPLRRSDYDVIGQASGHGCAHYVALWPLPIFWVDQEGGDLSFFNMGSEEIAERAAWYHAIASQPRADVMLSPRTQVKEHSVGFWYRRDCVDLTGKGIEIHLDQKTGQ